MRDAKERRLAMTKTWCHIGGGELICEDCSVNYPFRNKTILDVNADTFLGHCACCNKQVSDDYSICRKCYMVLPKSYDSLVERGVPCTNCLHGI